MGAKILVVEDDQNLGNILKEYLELKGYEPTLCRHGEEGYDTYNKQPFDICILDVMLPFMDGFTLAKKIRGLDKEIPIIFLTAKSLPEDRIQGFKNGGDDYMTKPFSMEELSLRVDAILRRSQFNDVFDNNVNEFDIGSYHFNFIEQMLRHGDGDTKLTTKEAALLKMLAQHKNKVLEREYTLKTIWGEDSYFTARSMDVFIAKLRKYLKKDEQVRIINIHGKGYKLVDLQKA